MGDTMVRKQIHLTQQLNLLLKQLAKKHGVSEYEVMRQAFKHEFRRTGLV
ncbi:MAG: hypothetical protein MUO30_05185 [Anaerolineales bacterium]|nr:hypothetical protein [Anaerolineales bacterium]